VELKLLMIGRLLLVLGFGLLIIGRLLGRGVLMVILLFLYGFRGVEEYVVL